MSAKRYTEEFKIEAVKQVNERGHRLADVAARLNVIGQRQPLTASRQPAYFTYATPPPLIRKPWRWRSDESHQRWHDSVND